MKKIVIDNGAGLVRGGYAGETFPRHSMPNCRAKLKKGNTTLVGDEIDDAKMEKNKLTYSRPHDRGYLINWEIEYDVWNRLFDDSHLCVSEPSDFSILFTEPPFAPTMLSEITNEIIFEEYGFSECYRCPAPALSAYYEQVLEDNSVNLKNNEKINANISDSHHSSSSKFSTDAMVVIDSGFSFTHVFCFYKGRAIQQSTVRLNVGGKFLTNYLKEILSYRQWNVMEEFEIVNKAKEALCFISHDFENDMNKTRCKGNNNSDLLKYFVLPNYRDVMEGFIQDPRQDANYKVHSNLNCAEDLQYLRFENERFTVPELLFNPSNVGMNQGGIHECVVQAIQKCPSYLRPILSGNILLTGGNANIPGYQERLQRELRKSLPTYASVKVYKSCFPDIHSWKGGSHFATSFDFSSFSVTKNDFHEEGHRICERKFTDW